MANKNMVNYAKAFGTIPSVKVSPEDNNRLHCQYDEFIVSAVIATTDVIYGPKIPAGARLHEVVLSCEDLGTTGVMQVGHLITSADAEDLNAFLDAVDVNAAAITAKMSDEVNIVGLLKKYEVETQVVITCTTATTVTAGEKIKLAIYYTF
jgi:hypothetical protein